MAGAARGLTIQLKRAAVAPAKGDGARILVERLWPRGKSKAALRLDAWLRDSAPSTELRKWFHEHPGKWDEFRKRYYAELDAHPEALAPLPALLESGPVTFVYARADDERNSAVALREYVLRRVRR